MYDCDEFDVKAISQVPYSNEDNIKKEDFISHVTGTFHRQLIKPALDYQKRLRRYLGGVAMWNTLTAYRMKWFGRIDGAY